MDKILDKKYKLIRTEKTQNKLLAELGNCEDNKTALKLT